MVVVLMDISNIQQKWKILMQPLLLSRHHYKPSVSMGDRRASLLFYTWVLWCHLRTLNDFLAPVGCCHRQV